MGFGTVDHKLPTNRVKLFSGHKYYVEIIYSRAGQSKLLGKNRIELAFNLYNESFYHHIKTTVIKLRCACLYTGNAKQ